MRENVNGIEMINIIYIYVYVVKYQYDRIVTTHHTPE
jgi:hypothetical protein